MQPPRASDWISVPSKAVKWLPSRLSLANLNLILIEENLISDNNQILFSSTLD